MRVWRDLDLSGVSSKAQNRTDTRWKACSAIARIHDFGGVELACDLLKDACVEMFCFFGGA